MLVWTQGLRHIADSEPRRYARVSAALAMAAFAHPRNIVHLEQGGVLAVAARYRAVKDGDAEKAARAQKKLDGIVIAATHLLMAMKTPAAPTKVPTSITITAFVICLVLIGWVAHLVFRRG